MSISAIILTTLIIDFFIILVVALEVMPKFYKQTLEVSKSAVYQLIIGIIVTNITIFLILYYMI